MGFVILLLVLLCPCSIALYIWLQDPYRRMPKGARKLPGPSSTPLIGRIHDIPSERTWLKFHEWSKEFGPIFKHDIFGTTHVWISSDKISRDLLAKQGSVFSDRPLIGNLPINKTGGEYLPLLGENDIWVRQRKFGHHLMTTAAKNGQYEYPILETKRLLAKLLASPESYRGLLEDHSSRNISRLAWGSPDAYKMLQEVTMALLTVISPSGALPNVIAPLTSLPEFLSPWKRYEKRRYGIERAFFLNQQAMARREWMAGTAKPSYMRLFLESQQKSQVGCVEGAYQVGMMAIAGALTIASPMMSFVLAMVKNPDCLVKLQEEIDRVCGGELPQMSDMENLPVLRAVVKEVLRWRPPVPTGIPHASTEDYVYEGQFIPAGSVMHAFEWGITRDSSIYPMADTFLPDRWLNSSYPTYQEPLTKFPRLEGHSQFGYGRRVCMGVDIVNHELFLVCGAIAWAFNLRKKIDGNGKPIEPDDEDYSPLLISKPAIFSFELTIRDEGKRAKVLAMFDEVEMGDGQMNEKLNA